MWSSAIVSDPAQHSVSILGCFSADHGVIIIAFLSDLTSLTIHF